MHKLKKFCGCQSILFGWVMLMLIKFKFQTYLMMLYVRDAFQKKNCPEGDIGTYRREGGKKIPFFASSKRGHIFMEGGVKIFLSHVPCSLLCFCFHTIWSISWRLAAWKFSISCNKVFDLTEKISRGHRVFIN